MPEIPPPRERKSIIPVLAKTVAIVPATVRARVSGFFEKPEEQPKTKQEILTNFLLQSTNEAINPQIVGDVLMGRCSDKRLLEELEAEAKVTYPEAVPFFRQKIENVD